MRPHSAANDASRSWIPSLTPDAFLSPIGPSYDGDERKSSSVLPAHSSVWSNITQDTTHDETPKSGSVHSPVKAVQIQQGRLNPKMVWIKRECDRRVPITDLDVSSDSSDMMTVKLDIESLQSGLIPCGYCCGDEHDDNSSVKRDRQWHRRPGDECLSFSAHQGRTKSRRMVPPTPLLLSPFGNKKTVGAQECEKLPVEPPTSIPIMIQDQLSKLEKPKHGSTGSRKSQRMTLLRSLEQELGDLDNKWAAMETRLGRDSMSPINSSNTDSRRESSGVLSGVVVPSGVEHRGSHHPKRQIGGRIKSTSSLSTPYRINVWETQLAGAQGEYPENSPELLQKQKIDFVSTSKPQLGSLMPPDSEEPSPDHETTTKSTSRGLVDGKRTFSMMWEAPPPTPVTALQSMLWNHPVKCRLLDIGPVEPAGQFVRSAVHRSNEVLEIESRSLWRKNGVPKEEQPYHSTLLWGKTPKHKATGAKKRVTQRPPRRNHHVALLPDILESPEPLPNKPDSLGIFQFPWQEVSDTVPVQHRMSTLHVAMPGTMTTGGLTITAALDQRSQQLSAEEYYSSFFEQYEDQNGLVLYGFDNKKLIDYDNLDEKTVWDMVNILKNDVMS